MEATNEGRAGLAKKYGAKNRENTNNIFDLGKLPPQSPELEEAVLGALMLEKNALTGIIDMLKPECFYSDAHQRIYRAIITLWSDRAPIDILTVTNQLKKTSELEMVGGAYYVTKLTNRVASSANIEYHARIILQKYLQRELIRFSSEVIKESYDESVDVLDLLDRAESNLFALAENNIRQNYGKMSDLVKEAIRQIESAREQTDGISGVPSGFRDLDKVTGGWQKSDLIIIAARPGMGKTSLVLGLARNAAIDFKKPVAFFSLEMNSVQLVTRLISAETGLRGDLLKKGQLADHQWQQLHSQITHLTDAPIFIDDTAGLNIFELRAKLRRLKAEHQIELAIIDYLQLMSGNADQKGNREQEISYISRSLKGIAKELNIPLIVLSQLNRNVETRGASNNNGKRPQLGDLRESGAIEQDADMVAFIYRPEYYGIMEDAENRSLAGQAQIIIAKHRNGEVTDVTLKYIASNTKFADMDYDNYSASVSPNTDFDFPTVKTFGSKLNNDNFDDEGFGDVIRPNNNEPF